MSMVSIHFPIFLLLFSLLVAFNIDEKEEKLKVKLFYVEHPVENLKVSSLLSRAMPTKESKKSNTTKQQRN
jgi:hypothetical protein